MSKEIDLAQKVRALKAGSPFTVKTEKQRQRVCRIAKALRDSGAIDFTVVTRKENGAFTVAAI
jgi:hypothetical protein